MLEQSLPVLVIYACCSTVFLCWLRMLEHSWIRMLQHSFPVLVTHAGAQFPVLDAHAAAQFSCAGYACCSTIETGAGVRSQLCLE